jgi:hypothetical protein
MNAFQFKAHPFLFRWVELFVNPGSQSAGDMAELLAIAALSTLAAALALVWFVRRYERLRLAFGRALWLALPAMLIYLPLVVTVSSDVLAHAFRFQDRFIVVFAIFVTSQTFAAFYAFALRYPGNGVPVGLRAGLAVSLFLLLLTLPMALLLLAADDWLQFL